MKLLTELKIRHCQIFAVAATVLLTACGGGGSDTSATTASPHVILTIPTKTTPIVTGYSINSSIKARFNQDMLASSITTSSFTLNCPAGTPITTTVTYDAPNKTAILQPLDVLPSNTTCEAKITTAVKNSAGVAKTEDYVWSFTTGAVVDVIAPTVTAHNPAASATGVCLTKDISATFSEPINSSTINSATFTVTGPSSTVIPGTVTYSTLSNTASFTTTLSGGFAASTTYTVGISTAVKDLAGNSLVTANSVGFTTGTLVCGSTGLPVVVENPVVNENPVVAVESAVNLGTIAAYGGFGGNAGITNQGINTVVTGDLGTTAACTLFTGFHDATNVYTETTLNIGLVTGDVYCGPPAPGTNATLAIVTQAAADALTAYNTMVGLTSASLPSSQLGGTTVTTGTYNSPAASFDITTGGNLILDGAGDPDATWIFKSTGGLTIGSPGVPRTVSLINGAQAKNVFWQVGSAARIEDRSTMVGTIIANSGVTISTAGQTNQTTLIGRAIGLNASVTMVNTTVTVP
jgi:hypothetical protein